MTDDISSLPLTRDEVILAIGEPLAAIEAFFSQYRTILPPEMAELGELESTVTDVQWALSGESEGE